METVKAMDRESEEFPYLRQKFPKISEAKVKDVVSFGLQITQQFEDQNLSTKLNSTERNTWKVADNICRNFLGNEKRKITVKLCRS